MNKLNAKSLNSVKVIYNKMLNAYPQWDVYFNENDDVGSASIEVYNNGNCISKYCFYPNFSGDIDSISIYGQGLQGHYDNIKRTNNIFGFNVKSISIESNNPMQPFVSVYLASMEVLSFTNEEKGAILQCFWQLLGGDFQVANEHNPIIKKIIMGWNLADDNWTLIAITLSPYTAFDCISKMSSDKKVKFKDMIRRIAEFNGNNDYKARMAISLFDKTNVPYTVRNNVFYW